MEVLVEKDRILSNQDLLSRKRLRLLPGLLNSTRQVVDTSYGSRWRVSYYYYVRVVRTHGNCSTAAHPAAQVAREAAALKAPLANR